MRCYTDALKLSREQLAPTHPLRLTTACNFATYLAEQLEQPGRAAAIAKQAFDESIAELVAAGRACRRPPAALVRPLRVRALGPPFRLHSMRSCPILA